MADRRRTKRPVRSLGRKKIITPEAKPRFAFLRESLRFGESYSSLVLGIIVVIAVAALLVSFARSRPAPQQKSPADISATKTQQNPTQPATGQEYTVQAGDDLWNIAEKVYGDGFQWERIAKANNITNPNMLSAGTKLKLPEAERMIAQVSPTQSPEPTASATPTLVAQNQTTPTPMVTANQSPTGPPQDRITGTTYTVVRGDTLWDIAERAYGSGYKWVDIARANNLQNPDLIHRGNVFTLPR